MAESLDLKLLPSSQTVPHILRKLYATAEIKNTYDALTVLSHFCMLENDFLPEGISDSEKYECMPAAWKAGQVYKISYSHKCCIAFICCVTVVPLYNSTVVHGVLCDMDCTESVKTTINLDGHLQQKSDLSDVDVAEVFSSPDELLRNFKDHFCLPLLNLLHQKIGFGKLYGFPALIDELKMEILKLLPVKEVLSLSVVNKNLNRLVNSAYLWKFLFKRDFGKGGVLENSSESNWYEKYRIEYINRMKQHQRQIPLLHPYGIPRIFPFDPDMAVGFDFDPRYPEVFPQFSNIHPLQGPPFFTYL